MARKQLPPRIDQADNGAYYVLFSDGGRSQRQSLRTTDLAIAQERFQGWLDARNKAQAAQKASTFAFAFRKYMEQHANEGTSSPKTLEYVGVQLNWFFGSMVLEDIKMDHIAAYTKKRLEGVRTKDEYKRPVTQGTVRKELGIMRAVFKFMCERVEPTELRADRKNLCYIRLPAPSAPRDRVLSDQEIDRLHELLEPPAPPMRLPRLERFLWLLLETGARAGALRDLKWSQVNLEAGFIKLNPPGREQNNKRRPTIPISDRLRPVLLRAWTERSTEYVLDHNGQIRKSLDRFVKEHHFPGVTAHVFRHTFATHLVQAGVPLVEVAQLLGDSLETVEKNYLHLSPGHLKQAINALNRRGQGAGQEQSREVISRVSAPALSALPTPNDHV